MFWDRPRRGIAPRWPAVPPGKRRDRALGCASPVTPATITEKGREGGHVG